MLNVKLVIVGASGVGKTSLRTKYTSGRFSTNYRATIGADFLTKTIPHPSIPDETVQLQIWDTAGQERFSGLSSAFFRGADAVILVYDVTDPLSLDSLTRWWNEFKMRCPIEEGAEADFPVAVVGNKMDLIEGRQTGTWKKKHQRVGSGNSMQDDRIVTEEEAQEYLRNLVPLPNGSVAPQAEPGWNSATPSPIPERSRLKQVSTRESADSRGTSRSRMAYGNGTMNSTAMSIYHTASSSLIDSGPPTPSGRGRDTNILNGAVFWDPEVEQAIAENAAGVVGEGEIALDSGYKSVSPAGTPNLDGSSTPSKQTSSQHLDVPGEHATTTRQRVVSSNSDSSLQTITPARMNSSNEIKRDLSTPAQLDAASKKLAASKPPPGPALFFTSAKTGENLVDVFNYIGERVVRKWEWEESQLHMLESGGAPGTTGNGDSRIILRGLQDGDSTRSKSKDWSCC